MKFKGFQPDNAILRREILHQERNVPRWVWWIELLGVVTVPLVVGPIFVKQAMFLAIYPNYYETLIPFLSLLWIIHALAAIRAIMAGAYVTSRDPMKQMWDDIAITGITKRQLIMGKWWAALHRVRGWMVALGVIQILIAPVFMLKGSLLQYANALYRISVFCQRTQLDVPCLQQASPLFLYPLTSDLHHILLSVAMALALTFLEMMCCTAIGMASGLVIRNHIIASLAGIILRFIPVGVFTFYPDYGNAIGNFVVRWKEYTWFALADGGSSAIMRLTDPYVVRELGGGFSYSFYAASGMMIGFLVVSFVVIGVVVRRGAIR